MCGVQISDICLRYIYRGKFVILNDIYICIYIYRYFTSLYRLLKHSNIVQYTLFTVIYWHCFKKKLYAIFQSMRTAYIQLYITGACISITLKIQIVIKHYRCRTAKIICLYTIIIYIYIYCIVRNKWKYNRCHRRTWIKNIWVRFYC
jgi:hypothetical protein